MKSSFTHLIVAVVLCAAALVGYGMWYAAITTTSTAVVELQNQIDAKNETASRITVARSALSEIASDEATVRSYFVSEASVVAFINDLESRGLSQGATVDVLSVSTSGTPAHPALGLTLTIRGSFDAVMRTVGTIEYAPYNISISQFSLGQGDQKDWHADFKLLVGSVSTSITTRTP